MSFVPSGRALNPPPRRLTPSVNVSADSAVSSAHHRRIKAYFSDLSTEQATLLARVLSRVPDIMKAAMEEHLEATRREMQAAFALPFRVIQNLNEQAWVHERWHEALLKELPCITLSEATARCESGPWELRSDLLVLAHGGRSHVPGFQFDESGTPAATWITLISVLRSSESQPTDWDVLAWLLRPHPLLDKRSPMSMHQTNPQRIRLLARSASRERLV